MKNDKIDKRQYMMVFVVLMIFNAYFSLHFTHHQYPVIDPEAIEKGNILGTAISKPSLMESFELTLGSMFSSPLKVFPLQWNFFIPFGILTAIIGFIMLAMYYKDVMYRQSLPDDEMQGSAKFNNNIKLYKENFEASYANNDPKYPFDPNMILADGLKMNMDNKKVNRNMNCLIVGGPGTGKSFGVIKPNLMQFNCSTITTDPSGELLSCCGKAQLERGIKVKLFSTSDMKRSNCYNPFDYVYNENGEPDETKVSTMIYLFLRNADGAKQKSGDPFWEKSAKALLTAIVFYLLEEKKDHPEVINFTSVLRMIQQGKVSEESYTSESQLDKMMKEARDNAERENRVSKAWSNYSTFKLATAKTANSILITCAVDLQLFDNEEVKNLTRTDLEDDENNLHLEKLGYEQTALYINIPQANGTYNFLVSMMYSQLFDSLYTQAEKICASKWIIKDEFNYPIISNIASEKDAEEYLKAVQEGNYKKVTNRRGVDRYEIKYKNKVILSKPSEYGIQKAIKLSKHANITRGREALPWHVRCLMDEFANIGEVPEFAEKLTTMRKYEISCTIVVQSISQLKTRYEKSFETIIGGCDTMIFLGSSENDTCDYLSKSMGDRTVRTRNDSYSAKGGSRSYSLQKRPLQTPAEIKALPNDMSYVLIRGLDPFKIKKYSFLNHPHFKLSGDGDAKNKLTSEMIEKLFNSTPHKKQNVNLKNKQKAAMVQKTVLVQPKTEQDVCKAVGAKTVEEAANKVSAAETTPENKKNIEEKKTKVTNQANVSLTDIEGGFLFG